MLEYYPPTGESYKPWLQVHREDSDTGTCPVRSLGQRGSSSQPIGAAAATVSAWKHALTCAGTGVGGALHVIKGPAIVADRAPGTAAEGTTAAAAAVPPSACLAGHQERVHRVNTHARLMQQLASGLVQSALAKLLFCVQKATHTQAL